MNINNRVFNMLSDSFKICVSWKLLNYFIVEFFYEDGKYTESTTFSHF